MTHDTELTHTRRRALTRARHALTVTLAMIAVGVVASGCGGSPSTRSTTRTGANGPGSQALAYSRCMRSHGVSSFPDPKISRSGNHASVGLAIPANLTHSPAFKTAEGACAKLAPDAGGPSGGPISAKQHAGLVKFAACMRSHGVSDFPDPSVSGVFNVPNNATQGALQAGIQKCQVNGLPLSISQGSGNSP